jgi:hypothetical protein
MIDEIDLFEMLKQKLLDGHRRASESAEAQSDHKVKNLEQPTPSQRARALIEALPDNAELERRANLDERALDALSRVHEDALRDVILEGCWVDVARAELARRGAK